MTAKRFELKIPLDLLEKIEEAARDYFKSPLNHTSKKPELTAPMLKLIEKGLEKIASSPDTDTNRIDTDRLNELIDEKIKEQLSVYKLDDIQTAIDNLQRAVFESGNRPSQPVSNPDKGEIVTPNDIPDSIRFGSKLFSVELSESTVDDTDTKLHQVLADKGEGEDKADKGDLRDLETLKSSDSSVSPISPDSSVSVDLSGVIKTQIEPVLYPDRRALSDSPKSIDNHNTPEKNSTDSVQVVSVEGAPNDDGNQFATEEASAVGTVSVSSPDTPSNDTTLMEKEQEKSKAPGAKVTLKGAWKHATGFDFKGSLDEFRNLFKHKGDVHYGVKILYLSNASASRNYEIVG